MPTYSSSEPSDHNGDSPRGRWSGHQPHSPGYGYGAPSDNPLDGWVDSAGTVGHTKTYGYQHPGQDSQPGYEAQPGYPGYNRYQGYSAYPGYNAYGVPPTSRKTKVAAALLAFFLGGTGAHNFYIGNTGRAIVQLVILVVSWIVMIGGYAMIVVGIDTTTATTYYDSYGNTTRYDGDDEMIISGIAMIIVSGTVMFGLWLWTFIEFIMILAGTGRYARDRDGMVLSS